MANRLYDKGREAFLDGELSWTNDDIKIILGRSSEYTVDLVNDEYLDDVDASSIVATSGNLASKTKVAGVADAANVVLSAVPAGEACDFILIYQDTGTDSTSRLIAYIDTLVGLPVTPSGANITITWSDGANKIFKL